MQEKGNWIDKIGTDFFRILFTVEICGNIFISNQAIDSSVKSLIIGGQFRAGRTNRTVSN